MCCDIAFESSCLIFCSNLYELLDFGLIVSKAILGIFFCSLLSNCMHATILFLAKPYCITWNTNLDENQLLWKF